MTDATFGQSGESAAVQRFEVRETRDRTLLHDLLMEDQALHAYALGHLEYGLFERGRYWVAEGPSGHGVLLQTAGGLGRAMFLAGDPAAIDALVSLYPGPIQTYLATASPAHLGVLRRYYQLDGALRMRRMSVTASTFAAAAVPPIEARGEVEVRPLVRRDQRALNALYASDGPPTRYTGDQIEQGIYIGAFAAGMLVSVAGTHVVSPNVGIAVVGNVFTHPRSRSEGLAERVTGAVTAELLERRGCPVVVLTVDPKNEPAVRAYRRLGYQPGSEVIEAQLRRRDLLGLGSMLRRWVARRAARRREAHNQRGEHIDAYAPGSAPGDEGGNS